MTTKEYHYMLDLETMSLESNAAIVSIGCVRFEINEHTLGKDFTPELEDVLHLNVSLASSVAAGLHIDPSTVTWWLGQSDAARASLQTPRPIALSDALILTRTFLRVTTPAGVWGNGASFDNVVLRNAYKAIGYAVPWSHWSDRCYRTMRALKPSGLKIEPDIAHNALSDAIAQTRTLLKFGGQLSLIQPVEGK
jgi:3' exoribonuclease, RNase T-like